LIFIIFRFIEIYSEKNHQMAEKETKIHGLGAKKLSLTGKAFYQPNGQNSFPVNKPSSTISYY
jgi:hypothetical protein